MTGHTNVNTELINVGKAMIHSGIEQYNNAVADMAAALDDFYNAAGDDGIDGGLKTRADKGATATSEQAGSTQLGASNDAATAEESAKTYQQVEEQSHKSIDQIQGEIPLASIPATSTNAAPVLEGDGK
ncbi:hypothetical protein [Segniliparus rugosus]|uniref:Uncharacterized protein n=1 Tax=Segniliparus rugosus (strain ATCC BAA-974 / DSM 45345 / CCUG 50838 / CIP 108380 / JCM 13579 / CDC 945) TaxID=679197 RepID=E5XQH4_SEGRC|nr:hypothetical protein [Segniliparus rugosus]EFV13392.1 hypothetical protein HMPREF9336_01746 [Segniliparus rugosus ATCC BAA-974]